MKLWAISDLHVGHGDNLAALEAIAPRPDDWLIVAGDVGERIEQLHAALDVLDRRFARLVWVPGNHELYTVEDGPAALRGEARYLAFVKACRDRGVLTPEDPWVTWPGEGGAHVLVPTFLLYDYSFRPPDVALEDAIAWAGEAGLRCADERFLHPAPYDGKPAWCASRVARTERRLAELPDLPTVLVNHFPLRRDLVFLPAIPRFEIWCGTTRTEDWHRRYRASVVVSGHLHVRTTRWRDGTRFEEVSLGYPRHWRAEKGADAYLRQILPGDGASPRAGDRFHR